MLIPPSIRSVTHLRVLLTLAFLAMCSIVAAVDYPRWWSDYHVVKTGVSADDYAVINQGQLKQFALGAYQEFEEHLPAGAEIEPELTALLNGFTTVDEVSGLRVPLVGLHTDDYAAVNLGQLKAVAKPFYDQLAKVNLEVAYPWPISGQADDFALANLGQVKRLFSFKLLDSWGDPDFPAWWQILPGNERYPTVGDIGTGGLMQPPVGTSPIGTGVDPGWAHQVELDKNAPGAPGLTRHFDPANESQVTLSWEAPQTTDFPVSSYHIYQRAEPPIVPNQGWVQIADVASGPDEYVAQNLQFGRRYHFSVCAVYDIPGVGPVEMGASKEVLFTPSLGFSISAKTEVVQHGHGHSIDWWTLDRPIGEHHHSDLSGPPSNADVQTTWNYLSNNHPTDDMIPVQLSLWNPPVGSLIITKDDHDQITSSEGTMSDCQLRFTPVYVYPGNGISLKQLFHPQFPGGACATYDCTQLVAPLDTDFDFDEGIGYFKAGPLNAAETSFGNYGVAINYVDVQISGGDREDSLPEALEETPGQQLPLGETHNVFVDGPYLTGYDYLYGAADLLYSYQISVTGNVNFEVKKMDGENVEWESINTGFLPINWSHEGRVTPTEEAHVGNDAYITVTLKFGTQEIATDTVHIVISAEKTQKDYTVSIDEASGPRYRKIALNGRPMPDSKPQAAAGSTVEPEETYIDAMTLGLRHSTTDIHIPVPGSDMALALRRDAASEIWSTRSGLRPHERPDRPFGVGWRSNITSYIEFEITNNKSVQATVTDFEGVRHRFVQVQYVVPESDPPEVTFGYAPLPTGQHESETYLSTLEVVEIDNVPALKFQKKGGETIWFEPSGFNRSAPPTDREYGTDTGNVLTIYNRAIKVQDRVGNEITMTYGVADTLIPTTIQATVPSTASLSFKTDARGLVTDAWDANGGHIQYEYESFDYESRVDADLHEYYLKRVIGADGKATTYTWNFDLKQDDYTPVDPDDLHFVKKKYHFADLAGITDANGHTYSFEYEHDLTRKTFNPATQTYFPQFPAPRWVKKVTLPVGEANFVNESDVGMGIDFLDQPYMVGQRRSKAICQISPTETHTTTYEFGNVLLLMLVELRDSWDPSVPLPKLFCYRDLTVTHGTFGSETFKFDPNANMALSETVDLCGNKTTFLHEDNFVPTSPFYRQLYQFTGVSFNGKHSEPTKQIRYLENTEKVRTFGYGAFRQPALVTDEDGNSVTSTLDEFGRVEMEEHSGAYGGSMVTEYKYEDANVPGLPTSRKVVRAEGDTSVPGPLETKFTYTAAGQLWTETVDPNPMGLNITTTHAYDASGNQLYTTDPNGNSTAFSYDARHRLIQVDYPGLTSKFLHYDARGNKTSETDEDGYTTSYGYDQLNRLTSSTRAGATTKFEYNYVGSQTAIVDPRGKRTEKKYDKLQRLIELKDANGKLTTYKYETNSGGSVFDSSGFKPTEIQDPRGYRTITEYDDLYRATKIKREYKLTPSTLAIIERDYDGAGRLLRERDPLNHETSHTYDALGRETITTFPNNATKKVFYSSTGLAYETRDQRDYKTVTSYDAAGRAVIVTGPEEADSPATETIYDDAGNVIATINPRLKRWDFGYDERNRKIWAQEPSPGEDPDHPTEALPRPLREFGYDGRGNCIATVDPHGFATFTGYDAFGRMIARQQPEPGGLHQWRFDLAGNLIEEIDENRHTIGNTYDNLNRLTKTVDAEGIAVLYEYDDSSNRKKVTDGNNHSTNMAYDGLGRLTQSTDALNHVTTFTYDGLNKTQREDANGAITSYEYDVMNRLWKVLYPSRTVDNREYLYDAANNLTSVTELNHAAANVVYTYDAMNRVETETSGGVVHTYQYDAASNRKKATYGASGRVVDFTYDALNRVHTLTEPAGGRTTTYRYDVSGNTTKKFLPNADVVTITYTALNQAETISAENALAANLYSYVLHYDPVGNLAKREESYAAASGLAARTLELGYDHANRLIQEKETIGGDVKITQHVYDDASNRTSRTITTNGVSSSPEIFEYNEANQLISKHEPASAGLTYTYDLNGNRDTRTGSGTESTTYVYDLENRLISVDGEHLAQALDLDYEYDYRSRRIERQENGASTQVIFSGGTSVQEKVSGAITVEFLRGPDMGGGVGGLLYALRAGEPLRFKHYDTRGDVVAETDGAGTLLWQSIYEGFGTRTAEFGTSQERQKANTKEEDPGGLLNEGLRYRDLETGTFLTMDPAGFVDGPNLYAYVRQNPWSKFDPEGLCEECLVGAQANRMMKESKPWSKSDTVGAALFFGVAAAPVALVAGEAALATRTAATAVVAAQGAVIAYNTNPVVKGSVDGTVTAAVTYAETKDPQAAVTNGLVVGATTYASTPKGGVPNPGGKSASQTRQLTEAELKTYERVEPRQGTREAVAETYTKNGKLYDAVTGQEIESGSSWVMGHKEGFEFRKMQADAAARGISRQQFIEEQNNPNIYQPELPSTSSRGSHEAPEHVSLPAAAAGTAHEDKY